MVKHLLVRNHPVPLDILLAALQHSSTPRIVEALLCKGANVHSTTSKGDTILHLAIAQYPELECLPLVKSFIEVGCNSLVRNSDGKTALEAAISRGNALVVEHLLSCNGPVPPGASSMVLEWYETGSCYGILPPRASELHPNALHFYSLPAFEDTILHFAIDQYRESKCLDLVKSFIRAGCNPAICNAYKESVLVAAIARRYTLVVEYLLSCNVPVSSDILESARQRYCRHNRFNAGILPSLFDDEYYQQIVELLNAADEARAKHPRPEDEMPAQVAKRPRLRYVEITLSPPTHCCSRVDVILMDFVRYDCIVVWKMDLHSRFAIKLRYSPRLHSRRCRMNTAGLEADIVILGSTTIHSSLSGGVEPTT